MIKRNLILFLGTAGILLFLFLLSFLPNSSLNIFIKIITLLVVAGWGYYYLKNYGLEFFQEQNRPVEKQTNAIPSSDDDSSNLAGIKVDKSVEEHFNHFLSTIFPLIKQTLVGNTVVLLLFNFYKKRFYRRYQISDFEDQLNPAPFYELSQGLPSLVFKNKQSLLENHLPENKNLLPYYISAELPAKSFLGVPLMLDDYIIGVLCIDSNVPESFSEEDLQILFEFSKIISIQLAESNKLYEYETENWSTHLLYEFSKDILNLPDKVSIWQFLGERLKA
ncbi:MAG: GAF domain-containing protein, partial [Nitrosopumilaceae archaeon]|nr:GAF domain-containing protein [Nitrosopumilaceae archaeon]NIU85859.1 GAF domain-containing protein [Nitrosopumilaceae archaeon]NIX61243.1 GAF domain-containing protein [Nitrosopumilaceae archaeon]